MRLRRLRDDDIETIRKWFETGALGSEMGWCHFKSDLGVLPNMIEVNGVPVGGTTLFNIDLDTKSAEISLYVADPRYRGRGLGFLAARKMLSKAFETLDLERVEARILATNTELSKQLNRVGFSKEAVLPEAACVGVERADVEVWDIKRETFQQRQRRKKR